MAKTPRYVNREQFESAIALVEKNGPLANRNELHKATADAYNARLGPNPGKLAITPSIVMLRIKEWNLTVVTPLGKRGRPKGFSPALDSEGNPLPRKPRAKRTASQTNLSAMRLDEFGRSVYAGLMQKIEHGSLTARIKANCLSCAGFMRDEIKHCQVHACPLWDVRPFQSQSATASEVLEATESNRSELLPILQ